MIILYQKYRKLPCCVFIPDELPWKLSAKISLETESSTMYELVLTAGNFEDAVLRSEDLYGVINIGEEEIDEAIKALYSVIIKNAAEMAALTVHSPDPILDLSCVIQDELEFWVKFYENYGPNKEEGQ